MGGWWFIPPVSDYSEWFNTDPFQLLERLAGFVDWQRRPYQRFEGSTHKILENPWFWVPLSMELPIEGYYFLVSSTRAWSQQHGLLLKFDQEESEVDEAGMVRVMTDVMAVKLKR